jgi:hypothetical protein
MYKKMLLVLCLLPLVMDVVVARQDQADYVTQSALMNKNMSVAKRSKVAKCFSTLQDPCCKRGKRGRRGKRGPRGRSSTSCGLNELFINAPMMSWFGQGILPDAFLTPYDNGTAGDTNIPAWTLYPSTEFVGNPPVGANFNVPIDLDVTKPVTAVIHMLVDSSTDISGDQAKLQVQMDYQPNNGILGSVAPAIGFADTQVSADFTVLPATPASSANMRQIAVSIPLDITKIVDNDWAFITVIRIAPATNEYSGIVYLSTISIQYSRLCS